MDANLYELALYVGANFIVLNMKPCWLQFHELSL